MLEAKYNFCVRTTGHLKTMCLIGNLEMHQGGYYLIGNEVLHEAVVLFDVLPLPLKVGQLSTRLILL